MPLTAHQQELYDFMSEISESSYCAGWMEATEYRLWAFMTDPADDGDWGQSAIPQSARPILRRLSARIDGWICYVSGRGTPAEISGPALVPTQRWLGLYAPYGKRLGEMRAIRTTKSRSRGYLDYHELYLEAVARND